MATAFELLRTAWMEGEPCVFLDGEAAAAPADVRRWSFLALRPAATLCVRQGGRRAEEARERGSEGARAEGGGPDAEAWWREGTGAWRKRDEDPWTLVRELARPGPAIPDVPFPYGVTGFASYDAGRLIERVPTRAADDAPVPWLLFFRFDAVWGQPFQREARLHVRPGAHAPPLAHREREAGPVKIGPIEARTSPKEFEAMVVRAKEHIHAGDVFQVNLSHRLECDVEGSPLDLYARLREVNPAPFSAFLSSGPLPWDAEGVCLLSSSPERLFSLHDGKLQARPIAGTRPRDLDPVRDMTLRRELSADPKERAEHVMMVDLARNDLGRVARFGSVRVPDLLTVETYRTVHHLVSVVEADLDQGKDAVDALVAMFPGGTITGAPKVRAMEIIDEIEPVRRAAYTGSLGWIGPTGDADFNILIRTLLVHKGRAHLQVGAGIVEESEPRREYEETLAKAKGLLLALEREVP